ncbi:hypothetical protein [Streptomyces acidiscabies]|uniref:DUF5666 domain-containing protein n=2 Tax=Streptomyces acidiscabies TaxID=42234 RepID=A0AAP6BB01_9ACTN|nr:hypothetical protein [Streptomyces acidiscabies]MBP5935125.1 hypothetical protein [Streptomyces sp. LBUM 1476]MBZ3917073.1 hypothetical protein [Streptomyces acidiscabies]MDX2961313.1 hypothetical protein [Streptomyces acidiscabies]MDX3022671.1 hypothetical protein [Streptomyces acidiscabies]MDX3792035.1 hypothetical protein [Streptomyces acidiscabies]
MRRTALLVPALLTSLALAAPASAAPLPGDDPGPPPAARAVGADGKPAKVKDVLKYCETKKSACSFRINRALDREFATAVRSLGNSVVNCTQSDMNIERAVTLRASSTDNIGGEISGKVTAEGTVNATGSVTTNLAQEISSSHKTPDLDKGPTSETGTKTTVSGGATVGGSLTARLAFEAEFKATYSKSWTVENTEQTTYKTTVKPHDILVFGASAAMRRVTGNLLTDIGSKILGISVDSPSMVNTSSFVAQTYAAPPNVCQGTRPTGNTAPGDGN